MNQSDFDWGHGRIVIWNLNNIDQHSPASPPLDELLEDLLWVQFPRGISIDVGWYPECSPGGRFVVSTVCNDNWDEPVFASETRSSRDLLLLITEAVQNANNMLKDGKEGGHPY